MLDQMISRGATSKVERGASLVGLLVVLVILGGVAALAVVALPGGGGGAPGPLQDLLPAGVPDGERASGVASSRPPALTTGATTAACVANVKSIEQAAAAKHALDGAFPANIAELVAGHWLAEMPSVRGYDMTAEVVGGRPTGVILVNGQPGGQGCGAAPRIGP